MEYQHGAHLLHIPWARAYTGCHLIQMKLTSRAISLVDW